HRTRQSVLNRCEQHIGIAFGDRVKGGFERGARDGCNVFSQKLKRCRFAKGAGFALKSHARLSRLQDHEMPPLYAVRYTFNRQMEQKNMSRIMTKPEPDEYASFYGTYVSLVQGNDILAVLESQRLQTMQFFAARSEREGNFRYAPDKWSVKE